MYTTTPHLVHVLTILFMFIHIPYYICGTIIRFIQDRVYYTSNAWPQFESDRSDPVIHNIPSWSQLLFVFWRRPLYLSALVYYFTKFFIDTLTGARKNKVQHLSDEEFSDLIGNGSFSEHLKLKNMRNSHDGTNNQPRDVELSSNTIIVDSTSSKSSLLTDETYYELDCMEHMVAFSKRSLPGLFCMGFKVLFKAEIGINNNVKLRVISIELKNETKLTPADGDAWKWAKVFVLSGIKVDNVYMLHPWKHFPLDALNAISSSILPENQILRQLLEPHLEYQLTVNNAVLYNSVSVVRPQWWNLWSTIPVSYESFLHLLDVFLHQRYTYCANRLKFHNEFPYGRFLNAYYNVVYDFVKDILAEIDANDVIIRNWAHHISTFVPGFPNQSSIFEHSDTLINVVANYIFQVSFEHSADHYLANCMPSEAVPHRLRITPPYDAYYPNISDNRACTVVDWLRQNLFDHAAAFNLPNPLKDTSMAGIDYKFSHKHLKQRNIRFRAELVQTEKRLIAANNNLVPLRYLLKSIEY